MQYHTILPVGVTVCLLAALHLAQLLILQLSFAYFHNVVHVQVAGRRQDVLHRKSAELQLSLVHELQQQPERRRRHDVTVQMHHVSFVQLVVVEEVEVHAAGGQNGSVRFEPRLSHQHGAVAEEALVSLLTQTLQ